MTLVILSRKKLFSLTISTNSQVKNPAKCALPNIPEEDVAVIKTFLEFDSKDLKTTGA